MTPRPNIVTVLPPRRPGDVAVISIMQADGNTVDAALDFRGAMIHGRDVLDRIWRAAPALPPPATGGAS